MCGISCLTNLTEFFEVVTKRSDDAGWQASGLEQSIGRLDQKVRSHGVQSKLTNWIQNWLSDWSWRMVEEGSFSDWRPVSSVVPQGFVLHPLLIVMYLNTLDENVGCMVS